LSRKTPREADQPFISAEGLLEYRSALHVMTPRCPTIEAAHILRAYVDDIRSERERIEEYGLLTLLTRIDLLAPFKEGPPGPVLTLWNAGSLSSRGRDRASPDEE